VQRNFSCNYISDAYGNFTQSETADSIYSQLTHLSDASFPRTVPDSSGYFLTKYYQQISPEQGKYTTTLDISYADVTRLDDIYIYLPSTRRPLRMSEASRCAPVPGSDFTYEESNNGPPSLAQKYKITYIGARRMMVVAHADPKSFESCGTPRAFPTCRAPAAATAARPCRAGKSTRAEGRLRWLSTSTIRPALCTNSGRVFRLRCACPTPGRRWA
jgi:hypothetical protein